MSNIFLSRGSSSIFFDLANNISQMAWIADATGNIIWFNKRWHEYTGMSEDDRDWLLLYHSDEAQKIKQKFQQKLTRATSWEGTYRIRNKQGKYNWFLTRVEPHVDEESQELHWFATHTNINRMVKLEKDLANEKALLQAVIDKIPAMVTIYDPEGMSIQLNPAFENLTGWTNQDAQEGNIMELVYPNPNYREEVAEFMRKMGPFFKDIEMVTKDGKILKTSWANEQILDGRQVGIGIDITDRKRMEEDLQEANVQLLNLNRLMENLLYMAAHDLKSPIANLKLIMSLIEDENEVEEKLSYFSKISTMIKRLEGVIDGLSEFIESQQQQNDISIRINIQELMEEVLTEFDDEVEQKAAQITIDNQVETINYEYSVLKNIVKNLVSNALKYSHPDRTPAIRIGWQAMEGFVLLSVSDNGIGIDLEKYEQNLFRPFKRFSTRAWGSGIGLFIIKNFIERNGGFIEVESLPERGTTFNCFLKENEED